MFRSLSFNSLGQQPYLSAAHCLCPYFVFCLYSQDISCSFQRFGRAKQQDYFTIFFKGTKLQSVSKEIVLRLFFFPKMGQLWAANKSTRSYCYEIHVLLFFFVFCKFLHEYDSIPHNDFRFAIKDVGYTCNDIVMCTYMKF